MDIQITAHFTVDKSKLSDGADKSDERIEREVKRCADKALNVVSLHDIIRFERSEIANSGDAVRGCTIHLEDNTYVLSGDAALCQRMGVYLEQTGHTVERK